MQKKKDFQNSEFQLYLEKAVLDYQNCVNKGNKSDIDIAYKKVTSLYNPVNYYLNWYEQYKYLFDSQEDFLADYLRVFSTVLLNWQPRNQRKKSRYDGSGEFKNYFIGSLYHNYINLIKADQAAKRNITKMCPLCNEWTNPLSTHLIRNHQQLLWDALEDMSIDLESLQSCPLCNNFKISKNFKDKSKITEVLKYHFISKHSSLLFHKFNELFPEISTFSPKSISSTIEEDGEELDIYEATEGSDGLISKLYLLDLSDLEKTIIEQAVNGDTNLFYKIDKFKCTKEEWEQAIENIKDLITLHGNY